jgi:hypothetical protein
MTGWCIHDNMQPFSFQPSNNTDWLLDGASQPNNINTVKNSIEAGSAIAVSDGSFAETSKAGTAGWIIEDPDQLQQLRGTTISPGSTEAQCSHRSELVGILGIISHVNRICTNNQIDHGTITIGCDGIGAIQLVNNDYFCKSSQKHYDIIKSIKSSIYVSPIKWKFRHIKGHQDDYTHFDNLDRLSQLNVLTDTMAKRKLQDMLQSDTWDRDRPQQLPHEKVEVYWTHGQQANTKICSTLQKTITQHIQTKQLHQYYIRKQKFSGHTQSYIDWTASKKSRAGLSRQRQKWLSKWITGFCGVGVMLKIYKYQSHSKCPRCLTDNETTTHVLCCQEPEAAALWNQSLLDLEQWMTNNLGGIWADFEFVNVFGFKMQNIIAPKARRLKSDNVRVRRRFQTKYKQYIKEHQLDRKLYNLQQTITTPQEFNTIMVQRKKGIQIADKQCRKLKMGGVPYSNKYKRAVSRIAVWKAVITKHKGCKFSMSKLRRLEKEAGIQNSLHTDLDKAKIELNKEYKEYWKIKKKAGNTE